MARQVIWSNEAVADLEALAEYIAKDSPYYAAAFAQELLYAGGTLNTFAERGRIVPEIGNPTIREVFIESYRLIYKIEDARTIVIALVHGARDLKALWEKENRK